MTAVNATTQTVTAHRGKIRNRVLWTLQIVLGLFFVVASGLPKLAGQSDAVRIFNDMGWGDGLRYFVGVVEISGGIGLLVPRLTRFAAAGLSVTTVLAAATQAFVLDTPGNMFFPLVLAVTFAWIAYERRPGHRG